MILTCWPSSRNGSIFSEAPPVAELLRDALEQTVREVGARTDRRFIMRALEARFGEVPPEIGTLLQGIQDEARLERLIVWSARCPDLEAFRSRLPAARPLP